MWPPDRRDVGTDVQTRSNVVVAVVYCWLKTLVEISIRLHRPSWIDGRGRGGRRSIGNWKDRVGNIFFFKKQRWFEILHKTSDLKLWIDSSFFLRSELFVQKKSYAMIFLEDLISRSIKIMLFGIIENFILDFGNRFSWTIFITLLSPFLSRNVKRVRFEVEILNQSLKRKKKRKKKNRRDAFICRSPVGIPLFRLTKRTCGRVAGCTGRTQQRNPRFYRSFEPIQKATVYPRDKGRTTT